MKKSGEKNIYNKSFIVICNELGWELKDAMWWGGEGAVICLLVIRVGICKVGIQVEKFMTTTPV